MIDGDGTTCKPCEISGKETIERLFSSLGKADHVKTTALATALSESFLNGMLLQQRLSELDEGVKR